MAMRKPHLRSNDKSESLDAALRRIWNDNWKHLRSADSILSQAELALLGLYDTDPSLHPETPASEVTQDAVRAARSLWQAQKLSSSTITKRLGCLSMLGVDVTGLKLPRTRILKWWLRPAQKTTLVNHLTATSTAEAHAFRDYIEFVTMVGLRVEEVLRLDTRDSTVSGDLPGFTVPGLKTAASQATLPLPRAAAAILQRRAQALQEGIERGDFAPDETRYWPYDYNWTQRWWTACRLIIGANQATATLKSLRRNAARYLHVDLGMPLDMVRHYLRHENVQTTMEYLRLTGGYGTEEMRGYFK